MFARVHVSQTGVTVQHSRMGIRYAAACANLVCARISCCEGCCRGRGGGAGPSRWRQPAVGPAGRPFRQEVKGVEKRKKGEEIASGVQA